MGQRIEQQAAPLETYGASPQEISFYITGNGSSAPLVSSVVGVPQAMVSTITRSSTGVNVITLAIPVNAVIGATATVDEAASPDGSTATIGAFTNEGSSTPLAFTVYTYTSSSAADMASGRKIRIRLRIRKSNWGSMQ